MNHPMEIDDTNTEQSLPSWFFKAHRGRTYQNVDIQLEPNELNLASMLRPLLLQVGNETSEIDCLCNGILVLESISLPQSLHAGDIILGINGTHFVGMKCVQAYQFFFKGITKECTATVRKSKSRLAREPPDAATAAVHESSSMPLWNASPAVSAARQLLQTRSDLSQPENESPSLTTRNSAWLHRQPIVCPPTPPRVVVSVADLMMASTEYISAPLMQAPQYEGLHVDIPLLSALSSQPVSESSISNCNKNERERYANKVSNESFQRIVQKNSLFATKYTIDVDARFVTDEGLLQPGHKNNAASTEEYTNSKGKRATAGKDHTNASFQNVSNACKQQTITANNSSPVTSRAHIRNIQSQARSNTVAEERDKAEVRSVAAVPQTKTSQEQTQKRKKLPEVSQQRQLARSLFQKAYMQGQLQSKPLLGELRRSQIQKKPMVQPVVSSLNIVLAPPQTPHTKKRKSAEATSLSSSRHTRSSLVQQQHQSSETTLLSQTNAAAAALFEKDTLLEVAIPLITAKRSNAETSTVRELDRYLVTDFVIVMFAQFHPILHETRPKIANVGLTCIHCGGNYKIFPARRLSKAVNPLRHHLTKECSNIPTEIIKLLEKLDEMHTRQYAVCPPNGLSIFLERVWERLQASKFGLLTGNYNHGNKAIPEKMVVRKIEGGSNPMVGDKHKKKNLTASISGPVNAVLYEHGNDETVENSTEQEELDRPRTNEATAADPKTDGTKGAITSKINGVTDIAEKEAAEKAKIKRTVVLAQTSRATVEARKKDSEPGYQGASNRKEQLVQAKLVKTCTENLLSSDKTNLIDVSSSSSSSGKNASSPLTKVIVFGTKKLVQKRDKNLATKFQRTLLNQVRPCLSSPGKGQIGIECVYCAVQEEKAFRLFPSSERRLGSSIRQLHTHLVGGCPSAPNQLKKDLQVLEELQTREYSKLPPLGQADFLHLVWERLKAVGKVDMVCKSDYAGSSSGTHQNLKRMSPRIASGGKNAINAPRVSDERETEAIAVKAKSVLALSRKSTLEVVMRTIPKKGNAMSNSDEHVMKYTTSGPSAEPPRSQRTLNAKEEHTCKKANDLLRVSDKGLVSQYMFHLMSQLQGYKLSPGSSSEGVQCRHCCNESVPFNIPLTSSRRVRNLPAAIHKHLMKDCLKAPASLLAELLILEEDQTRQYRKFKALDQTDFFERIWTRFQHFISKHSRAL